MAEGGIVDKLLGNEEFEEPEAPEAAEVAEAIISADTVATVVALDAARFDPSLSRKAAAYLEEQRALTLLAIKHFDLERHLAIDQARLGVRAAKRKAVADRIRIAQQFVFALFPLLIAAGLAILIYGAVTSRSVVVDTFQAPAALAPSGVTGQVVATGILDELQTLQDATRVLAGNKLATKSAWSSEIKIEVPETGVSIGEIDRLLREHLGHDIHIDGDLIQTADGGLALTVRGDGVLPKTFTGTAADLDKLTTQAGEYIYGRSQPAAYTIYLIDKNRLPEVLTFVSGASRRADDDTLRAQLTNLWGNALLGLNQPAEAAKMYRVAISLQPYSWISRSNLILTLADTEGEEAAWREARAFFQALEAAPKSKRPSPSLVAGAAGISWDFQQTLAAALHDASSNNGVGTNNMTDQPLIAQEYALLHDEADASRYLSLSDPKDIATQYVTLFIPIQQAVDRSDPAAVATDAAAFWKLWLAHPEIQAADDLPCLAALSLGMAGRTVESDAIFQHMHPRSRCSAAHGQILEHQGNLPAAEAVWADGIRIAPDLPAVFMARGLSEENRGDMKSAEADFAKASSNAPHFADPLKDWGDLLAREGRWKEARAKYDEALKYAPNWPELHQARDEAARKS